VLSFTSLKMHFDVLSFYQVNSSTLKPYKIVTGRNLEYLAIIEEYDAWSWCSNSYERKNVIAEQLNDHILPKGA